MNKFILLLLLICNSLVLSAQGVDKKYLAGALIETNGRISLERTIPVNKDVPKDTTLDLVEKWAKKTYTPEDDKNTQKAFLLTNRENDYLVCQGDDKLTFKSNLFMLDQAIMKYQLVVHVEVGAIKMEFRNIKYEYQDFTGIEPAEKVISDKVALNKDGTKLNRVYDTFRIFTIDRVDHLRDSLLDELSLVQLTEVVKDKKPAQAPSIVTVAETKIEAPKETIETKSALNPAMDGYKTLEVDKITEIYGSMLKDAKVVIFSNSGAAPAFWGGLNEFLGKTIASSTISSNYNDILSMSDGEVYTITFYAEKQRDKLSAFDPIEENTSDKIKSAGFTPVKTPTGTPTVEEAWLIIECKKAMVQPIAGSNDCIYMGEILNAWVK